MPLTQTDENLTIIPSQEKSYLIKGDISGIQDFIFNVKSKGAARSLKGRSFFLKILLELAIQMVFDAYLITEPEEIQEAKISTSGGNFILQLSLNDTDPLEDIQRKLTKGLQYTGLNIILAYSELKSNYQEALAALNQSARERKYLLLEGNYELFLPFERNEIIRANNNSKWQNITDHLRNASHFKLTSNSIGSLTLDIRENVIQLAGYKIEFGQDGIFLGDYLESIFPVSSKQLITFENLVKSDYSNPKTKKLIVRGGISKLGVLAMDVDNLGIVLEGTKNKEAHRAFDEKLRDFFNKEVAEIINKCTYWDRRLELDIDKYKKGIYVVTAGGDDSFFVGKWNTLLELALDIREAFDKRFKGEGKEKGLSISGALVIVNANFPIVRFASIAEDALKDAKYKYGKKGNINLFGEVLDWDILHSKINPLREKFKRRRDLISSGLLAKARQTAMRIAEDEGLRLSDFWQMGYYMRGARQQEKRVGAEILVQFRKYLAASLEETCPVKKRSYRLIFPIAARLAEFDNRNN